MAKRTVKTSHTVHITHHIAKPKKRASAKRRRAPTRRGGSRAHNGPAY